jgi:hypothetical protein
MTIKETGLCLLDRGRGVLLLLDRLIVIRLLLGLIGWGARAASN